MRQGVVVAVSAGVVAVLGFALSRRVVEQPPPPPVVCDPGLVLDPTTGLCVPIPPPPPPPDGTAVTLTIIPVNVPTDTAYVLNWQDSNNVGYNPVPQTALVDGVAVYFPIAIVPGRLRTYKQVPGNYVHAIDGPANWSPADGTTWVWDMANPQAALTYVPPA